jgi:CTD kinase subunit beta
VIIQLNISLESQPELDCKKLAKKAYGLAVDSYRTLLCVEYPGHTIAAGCIYLASQLLKEDDESFLGLPNTEPWNHRFLSRMEDIEGIIY